MGNDSIASLDPAVVDFVRQSAGEGAYGNFFRDALRELSRSNPAQRVDWLERSIRDQCAGVISERVGNDLYVTLPGSTNQPGVVLQAYTDAFSQIALMLAQVKLTAEVDAKFGAAQSACVYQFIDSARAVVQDARYAGSPVILFQPTDLTICTGHVGVVHYRCGLSV